MIDEKENDAMLTCETYDSFFLDNVDSWVDIVLRCQ